MNTQDIYSYVLTEESRFETEQVQVGDNWYWNFRNHVQLIFHLKNGIFYTGENNWLRAFKNIMEPILNLAYWTEDIEVKDVTFYTEGEQDRALSFLIKKYHDEVYVKENNIDTLFDEITESDLDYGGVLVQKTDNPRPEVLKLVKVAFCDQTDILGGPFALKFHFSPSKLRKMAEYGWGEESNGATISIEDLITLADQTQTPAGQKGVKNNTPGKTIEVYIVRGDMPYDYLYDDGDEEYCPQIQIIAYYTGKEKRKEGVTLYRKEDTDDMVKFFTSKEIENRALGRGEAEGLLHPQIWTNFLTIHKMGLIESGAKVPLYTDDPNYTTKNKIQDMENLEITTIDDGKRIFQVPTASPLNVQIIQAAVSEWYDQAQLQGAAFDPIMGKQPVSGTTFRGQERNVAQGKGLHDRRRGQRAKFIEEIYRDWILDDLIKGILKGKKFMASLSFDEMKYVMESVVTNVTNDRVKQLILEGKTPTQDEIDLFSQLTREEFKKKGDSYMFEILKGEFEDVKLRMGINVAGKQKDLAALSDKILSILQFAFQNPPLFQQTLQIPGMAKSFGDILEFSNIGQADFMALLQSPPKPESMSPEQMSPQQMPQPSPMQLNQPQPTA